MNILRGAFAGFAATIPMTATMQAMRAALPQERTRPMPPREIINRTVEKSGAGPAVDHDDRTLLTTIGHLAFGAAAGAVYAAVVGERRSTTLTGVVYGLAVWALAYGVGLPSLGLHPAAQDDTKDRNEVLIASHVVWGATLGKMVEERF